MRAPITDARRIPPRIAYTIVPVIIGPGTLMFDILLGICTTGSCLLFAICKGLLLLRCVVPFRCLSCERGWRRLEPI